MLVLLGSWKFLSLVAMSYHAIPFNGQKYLPDNVTIKLNQSVVLCRCGTSCVVLRDEHKLEIFDIIST